MIAKKYPLPGLSPTYLSVYFAEENVQPALNHYYGAHVHDRYEIYVNLCGDVSFEIENQLYPVSRGSAALSMPFEYHRCFYHTSTLHKYYWIIFSADGIDAMFPSLFHRQKGFDHLFQLNEPELKQVVDLFELLLSEEASPPDKLIGFLQMLRLIEQGQRIAPSQEFAGLTPDVARALQYIDTHLTEELDIKALSAASYVSVNTLERHFKEQLHISPSAMIRKKRLVESLQYLRNGCAISKAAANCGFSDHSNYIQHFKKEFGMTPLQYRKHFE